MASGATVSPRNENWLLPGSVLRDTFTPLSVPTYSQPPVSARATLDSAGVRLKVRQAANSHENENFMNCLEWGARPTRLAHPQRREHRQGLVSLHGTASAGKRSTTGRLQDAAMGARIHLASGRRAGVVTTSSSAGSSSMRTISRCMTAACNPSMIR